MQVEEQRCYLELPTTLKELNNNLARLVVAQYAMADELHMIRQCLEGHPGDYVNPIVSAATDANVPLEDIAPVLLD